MQGADVRVDRKRGTFVLENHVSPRPGSMEGIVFFFELDEPAMGLEGQDALA